MLKSNNPQVNKALQKCMHLCSQREYCEYDIYEKLEQWEITYADAKNIIDELTDNRYIDHERYVPAFMRDKLLFNHWGKIKIQYHLKQKRISDAIIKKFLAEVNNSEYLEILTAEMDKKRKLATGKNAFEKNQKIARYAISKGFEPALVFELLKLD